MKKNQSVATAPAPASIISPLVAKVFPLARPLFWGAIATGILTRILFLAARPLHHDESIHSTFSYYWYDHPLNGFYKYDPTYHGPVLYWCTRWIFAAFGVGVPQARLVPVIFGLGVAALPMLFQRQLGRRSAILAVVGLALSPLFCFYSRFLAHDLPSILFAVLALWGVLRAHEIAAEVPPTEATRRRSGNHLAFAGAMLGLALATKAVAFLYIFVFATGYAFVRWVTPGAPRANGGGARSFDRATLGKGALGFAAFYVLFQSSGLRYLPGVYDGIFGSVFSYWWNQHQVERVTGPGYYHLRGLALHQFPALFAVLVGVVALALRRAGDRRIVALLTVFAAAVLIPAWRLNDFFPPGVLGLFKALKIKYTPDLVTYPLCAVAGLLGAFRFARQRQPVFAFLTYWAFANLAIYSYVGEKGPWLTLHVAFPFIVLGTALAVEFYEKHAEADLRPWYLAVGAFALFWDFRMAFIVTHYRAGQPSELLSQVHNSYDVVRTVDWMKRESFELGEKEKGMPIAILGEPVWAFYFYLIENEFHTFVIDRSRLRGDERFVVTDDKLGREMEPELKRKGYDHVEFEHAGWWVPEDTRLSWPDWLRYFFFHAVEGTGGRRMWVFHRPRFASSPMASAATSVTP